MSMKQNIMLVDGMALLFRGFFATSFRGNFMKTSQGVPTNGIFGFFKYLLNAIDTFGPSHVICCWDMGSRTFRTELYDQYKGNREAPPEELVPQFDLVKEAVQAFDIPNIGIEGYEADDCIGTLARQFSSLSDVLILTGDQDILQLVDDTISVAIMKKGQGNYALYRSHNFYETRGLHPHQVVDLKALMGDTSDNYPGVKGIGEKTALKLLQEYHSVEGILGNLENLSKSIRGKIEQDLDMLNLSRKLAEIYCEVPVSCNLEEALYKIDQEKVKLKFEELEFKGLLKSLA